MKKITVLTLMTTLFFCWTTIGEIKWKSNIEEGFKNQKTNGKTIIIYFGASWCTPCIKLEKEVFSSSRFIDYSENFEMIKMYDDFKKGEKAKHDYYESMKKKFDITSIPIFVIIKSNKNQCTISGAYYTPEELIKQLNSCD